MLFDTTSLPLLEKYKAAVEVQMIESDKLIAAMKMGMQNESGIRSAMKTWEVANKRVQDLHDELESQRIDK